MFYTWSGNALQMLCNPPRLEDAVFIEFKNIVKLFTYG